MWCGGPSRRRLPSSIPAGYVSHTGYQYDSISRVAGHREPAPPSNFSKLGGFNNNVFITDGIYKYPLRFPILKVPQIFPSLSYLISLARQIQALPHLVSCWNTFPSSPVACSSVNWPCWRAKSASRKATHLS